MLNWIFSIITQSSMSRDPSEILLIFWFAAQETFMIIIINIKTVVLLNIFCQNQKNSI